MVGTGRPKGASVVYPVTGEAQQVGTVDAAAVREAIRGRAVGEARERLRDFGDADLDVWPDWVTAIPTLDFRLEIRVIADLPTEPAPSPSPTGAPTPTPRRSGAPSPSRSAAPPAQSGCQSGTERRAVGNRPAERHVTTVVGIDLGEKRIGVATADATGRARPHATILRGATVADDIATLRRVLGEPSPERWSSGCRWRRRASRARSRR